MMPQLPSIAQAYRIISQAKHQKQANSRMNMLKIWHLEQRKGNLEITYQQQEKFNFRMFLGVRDWGWLWRPNSTYSLQRCWKVHSYPPNFKPNTWREALMQAKLMQSFLKISNQARIKRSSTVLTVEQYKNGWT